MATKIITQPACEPVTLAEAKDWMRVEIDNDDAQIAALITAAREWVSGFTNRAFINTEFIQTLDAFPIGHAMACPYAPLAAVEKIRYLGTDETWYELEPQDMLASPPDEGDFLVDYISEPARLAPLYGDSWPTALFVPGSVEIHFTAGYNDEDAITEYAEGSPAPSDEEVNVLRQADVPEMIKTAIKMLVAHWYENREAAAPVELRSIPHHVTSLLWMNRVIL